MHQGLKAPGCLLLVAAACTATASAVAAPVPMVSGGRIVGVGGLGESGCTDDTCSPYVAAGKIVSVDRTPKTALPTGFRLQGDHGLRSIEILADWQGASMLDVRRIQKYLRVGRIVLVIGRRSGEPATIQSDQVISADFARRLIDSYDAQEDGTKPATSPPSHVRR